MYNVLHVIGHIGRGGDTTVVFDVLKNIDTLQFHFDFVTHDGAKIETVNELRKNGSKVYVMTGDVRKLGIVSYYKQFLKILQDSETQYDAIHVHTGMQSGVALCAAKKAGISKRICHSHVTAIQRKTSMLKKLLATPVFRFLYMHNATHRIACSRDAGKFMYGNKAAFTIIYNAVDIMPYLSVTLNDTRKFRSELGLSKNDIVIGHVARICEMKNQKFILELARRLKNDNDIKFVLVGDGQDFEKIKKLSNDLPNVILTGRRLDIPTVMKSFDCVLLPSLPGEGFPVTMIEAQAAGCQCIISENVTDEVEVGMGLVQSIQLSDVESWIRAIKSMRHNADFESREKFAQQLIDKGFGKKQFIEKWLDVYTK